MKEDEVADISAGHMGAMANIVAILLIRDDAARAAVQELQALVLQDIEELPDDSPYRAALVAKASAVATVLRAVEELGQATR